MSKTNENNKNNNGHNKYNPKVVYRHLGADVWEIEQEDSQKRDVAYTSEIEAELDALDSEESTTDEDED